MSANSLDIQFLDLRSQQNRIRQSLEKRFSDILNHQGYIDGPEVHELEKELKEYTKAYDCITASDGTQALIMSLMAFGVGKGDAVFLPGFTYNATANAVCVIGATPCFVDVETETALMCLKDLTVKIEYAKQQGLTPKIILPVDLYGMVVDYDELEKIACHYNLNILADAAQSFGAGYKGKKTGALADITTTSFYPAKILGCYGDGGAIFVKQEAELAKKLRSIRWHGTGIDKKDSIRIGLNGRLDSMQCAVVLEKLKIFNDELLVRKQWVNCYQELLKESSVCCLQPVKGADPCYSLFTIRVKNRNTLHSALKERGIPSAIYYTSALNQMPAFKAYAPKSGLPNCEILANEVLSLPLHPYLSETDIHYICEQIKTLI